MQGLQSLICYFPSNFQLRPHVRGDAESFPEVDTKQELVRHSGYYMKFKVMLPTVTSKKGTTGYSGSSLIREDYLIQVLISCIVMSLVILESASPPIMEISDPESKKQVNSMS